MTSGPKPGATGLFGGAFDPPHRGHLALARESLRQFDLARLVVTVTGVPPHKTVQTDPGTRLELARAAFDDVPATVVSRRELDVAGPSYTLDTVRWATAEYGEVMVIVGADQLVSFHAWHQPAQILAEAWLAVATRAGVDNAAVERAVGAMEDAERVILFEIPDIPISSSAIQARVANGETIEDLVPPTVARYVEVHQLYLDHQGA